MTGGALGEVDSDYFLLRAARYLRVAPWELAAQPQVWTDLALAAERAERAAGSWEGPIEGDEG